MVEAAAIMSQNTLQSYIGQYRGLSRFTRLLRIAENQE